MPSSNRQAVEKRLGMLWSLEAFNVGLLPLTAWLVLHSAEVKPDWPFWLASAASSGLLIQGAIYWKIKLNSLRTGEDRFPKHARPFQLWNALNPWLLLLIGLAILVQRLSQPAESIVEGLTWFFLILAVLEHVNYYHWQLMHDNVADIRRLLRRGIRRSQLWHDIRRLRR